MAFSVGERVRVVKGGLREDTVARITINDLGTTIYWLSNGGLFSASELQPVRQLADDEDGRANAAT